MHLVILWLALLLSPPTQRTMTVAECLTFNGDSRVIYDHPELAALSGVDIGADYLRVLPAAEPAGTGYLTTDTGERRVQWYLHEGAIYLFVYRDKEAPGAYERLRPGVSAWHGACMLRLT